jgi:hypothetical protein
VGMAAGVVDDFSWKAVAQRALGAGITAGVGGMIGAVGSEATTGATAAAEAAKDVSEVGEWISTAGRAALSGGLSAAATQAIQGKWSWRDIAANAVGSAAGSFAGSAVGSALKGSDMAGFASRMASSLAGAAAADQVRATDPNYTRASMSSMFVSSLGSALGNSLVDAISRPNVPPAASADEKAAILKMFEDGPGSTDSFQALRMPQTPSTRELMNLEEVTLTAGPGYKRSPTERFIEGLSGVLASKQKGTKGFGIPALTADQAAVADQLYADSMGELKEVIDYTSKNPTLRDALLRRYDDWMSEGGLAKPPIVQNVATAFGTLIGDNPTPEAAVALSMALGSANGIRSNPTAMGGLLGMLALANDTDLIATNLNTMAISTVEYDGNTYNSFQFGGTKANVMELAGALAYPVSGMATRSVTFAARVAMAGAAAVRDGVMFLSSAALSLPDTLRGLAFGIASRTATATVEATRAISGETNATAVGKAYHAQRAAARREEGDFDLVNQSFVDATGQPIMVTRRIDLRTGLPIAESGEQTTRPDAASYDRGLIVDDKPIGRPITKDQQEIMRFIRAYEASQGMPPRIIAIERYDPTTAQPVVTELYKPTDFPVKKGP